MRHPLLGGLLCLATGCRGATTPPSSAPELRTSPSVSVELVNITFPNGSRAEVLLPDIEGVEWGEPQPDVTLLWEGDYRAGAIAFSREGRLERILTGNQPVELLGQRRSAWRGRGDPSGTSDRVVDWLVVDLSRWTVLIPIPVGVAGQELSAAVHPRESSDGLVVVETDEPASLARGFGESGGPQVTIGDAEPLPGVVNTGANFQFIQVAPDPCTPEPDPIEEDIGGQDDAYAGLCLADGRVFVSVYGDRVFVRRVAADLRVVRFTTEEKDE